MPIMTIARMILISPGLSDEEFLHENDDKLYEAKILFGTNIASIDSTGDNDSATAD